MKNYTDDAKIQKKINVKKIVTLKEVLNRNFDELKFKINDLEELAKLKSLSKKAGSFMWSNFSKKSTWGQKYPGKMIQSMAMFEIFYASRLHETRKAIERYKKDNYKKNILRNRKKEDEEAIRSLFGINEGRKSMRKALGMNMETPTKDAIKKFWLLGEFLELGIPKDNKITVDKEIKKRQDKLDVYKATISTLKKKLEERAEEKENKEKL